MGILGQGVPEAMVWRDALGRVVQRAPVVWAGKTAVLHRGDLPTGAYLVEVLGRNGTLGTVRVLCE